MSIDAEAFVQDLDERRALAKEKFDEDPLPVGDRDARLRLKEEIARFEARAGSGTSKG